MKQIYLLILLFAVFQISAVSNPWIPIITTGTFGTLSFNDTQTPDVKSFNETFYVSAAFRFRYMELLARSDLQCLSKFNTYSDINYLRKINPSWYLRMKWNAGNFLWYVNVNPVLLASDETFRISGSSGFYYRHPIFRLGLSGTTRFYDSSGCFLQNFQLTGTFKQKKPVPLEHQCSLTFLLKDSSINDEKPLFLESIKYKYQLKINLKQFKTTDSSLPLENMETTWEDDD